MCFSAPVSFLASAGLTSAGVASARVAHDDDTALAPIPLMFGIQQFFEGVQWLSVSSGVVHPLAKYGFLLFAFLVWPLYIPIAVYRIDHTRPLLRIFFMIVGLLVTLYLLFILLTTPVLVYVRGMSIVYDVSMPYQYSVLVAYLLATCGAPMTSSKKEIRFGGVLIFTAALISGLLFEKEFVSVWCFFSAIISGALYWYLRKRAVVVA